MSEESIKYPPLSVALSGNWAQLLRVFGPGAIIASVTVGTGETIFAPRIGAVFGYALLWVILLTVVFKAVQVYTGARYLVLTGEHPISAWSRIPGPRAWVVKLMSFVSIVAFPLWVAALSDALGSLCIWITGIGNGTGWGRPAWATAIILTAATLSLIQTYNIVENISTLILGLKVVLIVIAVLIIKPDWGAALWGLLVPRLPQYEVWVMAKYPDFNGRTQGTPGMFDSLPYRNDAAIVLRRLIRSLPTRQAVIGVATCDKGLPAMMLALAGSPTCPAVLAPGGVTLPASNGDDAGRAQTIGARFANGQISLAEAADIGCRACASPGGGCQFLGTAATSQVVAEALGLAVPHSALAPSGQSVWLDAARRSVRAMLRQKELGITPRDLVTDMSVRNAMAVHAAFGGSTNLLLHLPAVAHAAGLEPPTIEDWISINRRVPRLVEALPNGTHTTVRVFLAGGVPEVMLHLRQLGLLDTRALTAVGKTLDEVLDEWETSERRKAFRARLSEVDGVDPDEVILPPERARARGLTSTICYVKGNLAPQGAIVKSSVIARSGSARTEF